MFNELYYYQTTKKMKEIKAGKCAYLYKVEKNQANLFIK